MTCTESRVFSKLTNAGFRVLFIKKKCRFFSDFKSRNIVHPLLDQIDLIRYSAPLFGIHRKH